MGKYMEDNKYWYRSDEVDSMLRKARCGFVRAEDVYQDILSIFKIDGDFQDFDAVEQMIIDEYHQYIEDTNIIYDMKGFIAGFRHAMQSITYSVVEAYKDL